MGLFLSQQVACVQLIISTNYTHCILTASRKRYENRYETDNFPELCRT